MEKRKPLKQKVWESDKYIDKAELGSQDYTHPGMKILKHFANNATSILDLGCGEGTRLSLLTKDKKGLGVDISEKAIRLAKKRYPRLKFKVVNLEKLPLKRNSFSLVYSAYVLEHLRKPEKVINEAVRVTRKGGNLVLIAPNYGAPNRASPPFKGSRIRKLSEGFLKDLSRPLRELRSLNWSYVEPLQRRYKMDFDTTVEPYIRTLMNFLKNKGMRIEKWFTCWPQERPNPKLQQRLFRFFGEMGLYPFTMWGPHIVVIAKKLK